MTKAIRDGRSKHPLYARWKLMLARCEDPRSHSYKNYGARGIFVCARWRNDFWAFAEDMGPFPPHEIWDLHGENHWTVERVDNDGPYDPMNCRWATPSEQNQNQRPRPPWVPDDTGWSIVVGG